MSSTGRKGKYRPEQSNPFDQVQSFGALIRYNLPHFNMPYVPDSEEEEEEEEERKVKPGQFSEDSDLDDEDFHEIDQSFYGWLGENEDESKLPVIPVEDPFARYLSARAPRELREMRSLGDVRFTPPKVRRTSPTIPSSPTLSVDLEPLQPIAMAPDSLEESPNLRKMGSVSAYPNRTESESEGQPGEKQDNTPAVPNAHITGTHVTVVGPRGKPRVYHRRSNAIGSSCGCATCAEFISGCRSGHVHETTSNVHLMPTPTVVVTVPPTMKVTTVSNTITEATQTGDSASADTTNSVTHEASANPPTKEKSVHWNIGASLHAMLEPLETSQGSQAVVTPEEQPVKITIPTCDTSLWVASTGHIPMGPPQPLMSTFQIVPPLREPRIPSYRHGVAYPYTIPLRRGSSSGESYRYAAEVARRYETMREATWNADRPAAARSRTTSEASTSTGTGISSSTSGDNDHMEDGHVHEYLMGQVGQAEGAGWKDWSNLVLAYPQMETAVFDEDEEDD